MASCGFSHPEYDDSYTLDFDDRIIFNIDSTTSRNSSQVGYSGDLNSIYLFNEVNYTLYFFDVDSRKNWNKIKLFKDGPLGINDVSKIYVVNIDSILTFSTKSNILYLITEQGKKVTKHKVFSFENPDPTVQLRSSSVDYNKDTKEIFLPIRPNNRTDAERIKSVFSYSLESQKKQFFQEWPEDFGEWGVKGILSYGTLNRTESKYIVSNTSDHQIHVTDLELGSASSFYAGSDLIKAPNKYKGKGGVASRILYQRTNSWYGNIYYDHNRKVYYRDAMIGSKIPKGNDPLANQYPSLNGDDVFFTTIILDDSFKKIGEVKGLLLSDYVFSNDAGVYVRDYKFDRQNEDILVFSRYQLKSKK
tara:strand:+ start:1679 stop:2761 length:1083 start_codon:yes stop_codon:yes gene_type:complete